MRLPPNTKTENDLMNYLETLKNSQLEKFQTGSDQSLHKWEVLIEWAKKKKTIPKDSFNQTCGLCVEHNFPSSLCEGCPLHIKDLSCFQRKFWNKMNQAVKDGDINEWIKEAEKFYIWMKNILR